MVDPPCVHVDLPWPSYLAGWFHLPTPGAATFLLPAQLPPHMEPQGLATELLSFGAARRHLPKALADAIAGRTALHSYGPGILDEWMSLVRPNGCGWKVWF